MRVVFPILGNRVFPIVFPSDLSLTATPIFYIFYGIEFTLTIFTAPVLLKCCRAFDNSVLFHRNAIIIIKSHYCALYVEQLFRLVVIFYEVGLIDVSEKIEPPSIFIATCFACVFFKTICITIFPSLLIERFFASHYIDDYEAKSRVWVAIMAVLSACILSLCYTISLIFGIVGIDKVALFCIGVCFVFSFVFLSLHRRDSMRFNDFVMKKPLGYELSTRFQLVENLRVLKIIRNASLVFSIWALIPCAMLVLVHHYFSPDSLSGQIVYASYELKFSLFIAALYIISIVALSARSKVTPVSNCGRIIIRDKVNCGNCQVVTEKYFQQLGSAWA
uniref:Serpentine Receptor, class E (Epsilon) n=1 Tax=Haemonchus contortus TaxID=6289 RepID=A0A7I4Y5G5_HAECO